MDSFIESHFGFETLPSGNRPARGMQLLRRAVRLRAWIKTSAGSLSGLCLTEGRKLQCGVFFLSKE
jgi:hypothetical protein